MKIDLPEILAPAGNRESFNAAVNAGADAVYLGVGAFNARAKADNFQPEELEGVVKEAHIKGVKVYLTLNILVKNEEIAEVLEFAQKAVTAKVDAFIVQDMGLARLLFANFPNIVLHASTQMGVHNAMGARVLKSLGFKRVVLARETTLEDIKAIAAEDIEVEYFVQGALCVAFSGNCYMSANALDKSGNRGLCAQLCRLEYVAESGGKTVGCSHYLSAADLCFLEKIDVLKTAGVTSFKIEGRLRRPAYVAEAVLAYKEAIANEHSISASKERLSVAFSRGKYNEGEYLEGSAPRRIIEDKLYNHAGKPIGKVESCVPFKNIFELVIKSSHKIENGDGLKFFEGGKEIGSIGVGSACAIGKELYKVYTGTSIKKNSTVNLISDGAREREILALQRQVPTDINVVAKIGKPLELTACARGVVASYVGDVLQAAKNAPTSLEEVTLQCKKSGGSAFVVQNVTADMDEVFIPKSVLNGARREVLAGLESALANANSAGLADAQNVSLQQDIPCEKDCPDYIQYDDFITVFPEDWNDENCINIPNKCNKKKLLELPIICNLRDFLCISKALERVKDDIYGVIANNLWGLELIKKGYRVLGGYGLNIYNKQALYAYRALGIKEVFISEEAKLGDFLGESGVFATNPQDVPVMTLAHCPVRAVFGNTCESCKYTNDFCYKTSGRRYFIKRYKISKCYFKLYWIK